MSSICSWNTAKGDLPHLYYILCKLEPIVTEFKTVACYVTGYFLLMDIYRGKEGTNKRKCHMELGAMEACKNKTTEATKGLRGLSQTKC